MARVRLISHNMGAPLVLLAIKTSAGRVREKGVDYYLHKYPEEKPDKLRKWLLEAAEKFPSVLEHVVFTFMIEDVSRACTHQLVRHRIASYTQESQRYSIAIPLDAPRLEEVAEKLKEMFGEDKARLVALANIIDDMLENIKALKSFYFTNKSSDIPPGVKELYDTVMKFVEKFIVVPPNLPEFYKLVLAEHSLASIREYLLMVAGGAPPEDARYILPQAIKTRIMMTVNLRELLHIANLRLSKNAQWEIREVVSQMIEETKKVIPEIRELIERYRG